MTNLQQVRKQTGIIIFLYGLLSAISCGIVWYIGSSWLSLSSTQNLLFTSCLGLALLAGLSLGVEYVIARPLLYLSQFIQHIASDQPLNDSVIPRHQFGHDLVKDNVRTLSDFVKRVEQSTNITSARAQIAIDVVESIDQPLLGINDQGQIVLSNRAARELSGKDQLTGELVAEALPITNQGDNFLMGWIEQAQHAVVNKQQAWQEVHFSSRDRQDYVFEAYASFSRNQDGGLETTLLLIDVTSEHAHDDMKVDFAAMAAHELRAPITVIRGYLDVFETELRDKFTAEEQTYIDKLKVSADQLNNFVSNTLVVSRIDKGEFRLRPEAHDWRPIIENAIADLQLRAEVNNKQLVLNIADDLPQVLVDPISITEVISNLVDNAIKYSKTSEQIEVNVGLSDAGWLQTTIVDHGIGIPANLVSKLFTKYYRSHRSKDNVGGSGIGLYLSKVIVDQHQGQIWAQSIEGQGSTFGFSLPPLDEAQQLLDKAKQQPGERSHRGWIKNHTLYRR